MLKFILTTLAIIFFIRLVAPVLFRWLLSAFLKKSMRNGNFFYNGNLNQQRQQRNNSNNGSNSSNGRSNGDVRIDYIPEQPNRSEFNGGEYVDYEEVK
ncbi:DUF4834 family protein [Pontibacter silvestris]|uniref:DUF4834 family protein n=1 Tax=Pontibacter silvestris TaxID=2305183 RepID=A0ABW4WUI4_9BACT|nr:DUF4834 family protein [Pontibacter silvestris]MCC9136369.1 DUF4834 family protein [Pontibacter silvestris]